MTSYKYEAISRSGKKVTGVITANDYTDAVIQLKETCSVVNSLKEVKNVSAFEFLSQPIDSDKVNDKSLSLVCKQFAIILGAGLPIVKSIELVANQAEDQKLKKILFDVADDVRSGYSLANSFSERAKSLPMTFIETIRAGEESGELDKAFEKMSTYLSKRNAIKAKVVTALTYPVFVMAVAVVVIGIIMVKAVPAFTSSFAEMKVELPWPTKAVIAMSNFFTKWTWLLVVLVILGYILFKLYQKTENGRIAIAKAALKLPVLGKVNLMNAASQYASTLTTMLAAGLPAVNALTITGKSVSNAYIGEGILKTVGDVESGERIGDGLRKNTTLPDLLIEMTSVGEESGKMEETLSVIGEYYDNEVEVATERAVSLLEPAIICFLAVFVVLVLLAVYLPMFSMYGSMTTI